ncbi:N-O-diacetylmuramidase [Penicillium diatomitis]|uniref:N,O-diacetylmuramidase n=1 Tax=Penicillium diatomitis TaxID=2819901 RepID=A0A9W9X5E7_9EURO|nr:N-O-diacetylmuramidase [Penicillium diatomitis]KAJ5484203.1 N-O-diacetylmuramidase [Penicillium diatomitis]
MKASLLSLLVAVGVAQASVQGFDISGYQSNVDFAGAYSSGARIQMDGTHELTTIVVRQATEGTTFTDSTFSSHYTGATSAGLIRGGYHFARPDTSSGATQASFFLAHGGGWSSDGITLPGMLDIEYNPYGATCYGLSASSMVAWIRDFGETYKSATGRYPMIYTTADWWNTCTGGSTAFSQDYPLVLARYSSSVGTIPGGWPYQSFWQNADSYAYGGDSDLWNGSEAALQTFARG